MLFQRMKRDDGQVSLAVVLLSLVIIAAAVGVFIFGEAQDSRSRAQKAADASALAAAKEVRKALIPLFNRAHIPPPPAVGDGHAANPTVIITGVGHYGGAAAHQYAQKNEANLTSYFPSGNLFTSSVQAVGKRTQSTVGDDARSVMSAPAEATAKVRTDAVRCWGHDTVRDPRTRVVITWKISCSGNGHQATVSYAGQSTMAAFYDTESWLKIFDIKLEK